MPSKLVVSQQKRSTLVSAAAETHAEAAAEAVAKELSPHLEKGEKMPDTALLLRLAGRLLASATGDLIAADEAHERELSDDAEPRQRRDELSEEVYDILVSVRDAVQGVYGAKAVEQLGLAGRTPRDPVLLARVCATVIEQLGAVKLPKPRIEGSKVELKGYREKLTALHEGLTQAIKDVARETREAEQTQAAKTAAFEAHQRQATGVAHLLTGVFRLAHLDELADRVRPTQRKSASEEEVEPAPADEPKG